MSAANIMNIPQRIDIVYTWVDDSDQQWVDKKMQYQLDIDHNTESFATVKGRFRNNNELLFSLRALDQHFPNHGKVFIVTDKQLPTFLNNQVIMIDHSDIMSDIPTFSSKKIESNLFKIKELSEFFIYFNDDVFLGPRFSVQDYFKDEKFIVHFDQSAKANQDLSHINAASLSRRILRKNYPTYLHNQAAMAHAPKAVIKSRYHHFLADFYDTFLSAQKEVFRQKTVPLILGDLFPRWALHHGLASSHHVANAYLETSDSEAKIAEFLSKFNDLHYFCINDTSDNASDDDACLTRFSAILETLLPTKSRYEKR